NERVSALCDIHQIPVALEALEAGRRNVGMADGHPGSGHDGLGAADAPQHRALWAQIRHFQLLWSLVNRGSRSPLRVAATIVSARSTAPRARCGSNGSVKCKTSHVSAFTQVMRAGLVLSR